MNSQLLPAFKMLVGMTLLTGVIYPAFVTAIAQVAFPHQANGSLVLKNEKVVGSSLIAQDFKEAKFFHARPSAIAFNPMPSGGSNLGPTSADLLKAVQDRIKAGDADDLLFSSASGLDPEISPAAAMSQVARVAPENHLDVAVVKKLVENRIEMRTFGFLGEPRVNVLLLNLDLLEGATAKR